MFTEFWSDMYVEDGLRLLSHLARILLSVLPSEACVERLFSYQALSHTKVRNRMKIDLVDAETTIRAITGWKRPRDTVSDVQKGDGVCDEEDDSDSAIEEGLKNAEGDRAIIDAVPPPSSEIVLAHRAAMQGDIRSERIYPMITLLLGHERFIRFVWPQPRTSEVTISAATKKRT